MANEAAYCCAAVIFVILVVFFAVSMRTNARTRRFCQGYGCSNIDDCPDLRFRFRGYMAPIGCRKKICVYPF